MNLLIAKETEPVSLSIVCRENSIVRNKFIYIFFSSCAEAIRCNSEGKRLLFDYYIFMEKHLVGLEIDRQNRIVRNKKESEIKRR